MSAILVYVTCENEREALAIARELVSSKIVACTNIIPETKAVFKWEGVIQEQSEAIVILKSQKARLEEITERIQEILEKEGYTYNEHYIICSVPNIIDISYGRDVGYTITQHELGKEIHDISATKIRAEMREEGKV